MELLKRINQLPQDTTIDVDLINEIIDSNNQTIGAVNELVKMCSGIIMTLQSIEERKKTVRNRLMKRMNDLAVSDDHPLVKFLNTIKPNKKEKTK